MNFVIKIICRNKYAQMLPEQGTSLRVRFCKYDH